MLQATVLGTGLSPGHVLHAREHSDASPGDDVGVHFASPRTIPSSSPGASSSSIPHSVPSSAPSTSGDASGSYSAGADEALTWTSRSVTWSRGVEIVRRFTYPKRCGSVVCAVFAWFDTRNAWDPDDSSATLTPYGGSASDGVSASAVLAGRHGMSADQLATFGPFHRSQYAEWQVTQHPQARRSSSRGMQRCVAILLTSTLYIYLASGEDHSVAFDLEMEACWPLSTGGLLLQRKLRPRELRALGGSQKVLPVSRGPERKGGLSALGLGLPSHVGGAGPATAPGSMSMLDTYEPEPDRADHPRVYHIKDPFNYRRVCEGRVQGGYTPDEPTSQTGSLEGVPTDIDILYVSADPYPFVVAYDAVENEIVVFRRTIVPTQEADEVGIAASRGIRPSASLRPSELLALARQQRQSSAPRRSGRNSLTRGLEFRSLSASAAPLDPLDRTRRRASRMSTANEGADEFEPNEFAEAAKIAFPVRAPKGKSRMSGIPERHELPVGTTASNLGEEDLRDTTMMMDLLSKNERRRSDVVLDRIWKWSPPGRIDRSTARVFLTENRSPELVFLNLVLTVHDYPPTLFTFKVELVTSPSPRYVFTESRATHCVTAVPVIATRRSVFDTLVLTDDGSLRLLSGTRETVLDIPRVSTVDGRDEVAVKLAASLSMVLDRDGAAAAPKRCIVDLVEPSASRVTVVYNDGERVRVSLDFTPALGLARRTLEALSHALSDDEYAELAEGFLMSLQARPVTQHNNPEVQWRVLTDVLFSKCGVNPLATAVDARERALTNWATQADPILRRLSQRVSRNPASTSSMVAQVQPVPSTPRVLLALHLVAQDCRLSATTEPELAYIAPVILRVATSVGREDWADYWRRLIPTAVGEAQCSRRECRPSVPCQPTAATPIDTSILDQFYEPPDILLYLQRALLSQAKPFPTPESCLSQSSPLGSPHPCRQTELVTNVYGHVSPTQEETQSGRCLTPYERAAATVRYIVESGLTRAWVDDLAYGLNLPIMEMIKLCQRKPPRNASADLYGFIDREDLAVACVDHTTARDLPQGAESQSTPSNGTIGQIMGSVPQAAKHNHYSARPHVRFGLDRRLDEVERIMQTSSRRTISMDGLKTASDPDEYSQQYVNVIANRTFAVTVGRAMFEYGSRMTEIAHEWDIPAIDLSVRVLPLNQVLQGQMAAEQAQWPNFHNGVGEALSISPEVDGITASWIQYNRHREITTSHAGFLLGLGLMGHLRSFSSTTALHYLNPSSPQCRDITSMGLLLGLGASFAGSQDETVTSQMTLHATGLLPKGSMVFVDSILLQSVALVGAGLVHVGSKNVSLAERALAEIPRAEMKGVECFTENREAYAFSASMMFGLIMLGRGSQTISTVESRMLESLRRCIQGDPPDVYKSGKKEEPMDATLTSPGATLALGLWYLRTGRKDVAAMLEIPQTTLELESVRPDQLLVRTFARALIMWDDVRGTMEWVDAQLPPFIRAQHAHHMRTNTMELNTELAYMYIVAGACLAIGMRYASTANEAAYKVLLTFFTVLAKGAAGHSMTYEAQIRRTAARQALNIATLAVGTLMAGSGDLQVLRRLRNSHGQEGVGVTYGSHMAMHMALGLLFLGRGYFGLGNSNLAIAAMSIAFFPRFSPSTTDNSAYPQAFRHLWALAAEPRCLIARDVDTRESIFIPIKIKTQGGAVTASHILPTLAPPFNAIDSIVVETPRYWPVHWEVANNARDLASLLRTRTLWVKRKVGYLDYHTDPKGYRSMFARIGTNGGIDMHYDLVSPAAPDLFPVSEYITMATKHTVDPVSSTIARTFVGESPLERFIRFVLLETLSQDKPVLATYLALIATTPPTHALERTAHLQFLNAFYGHAVYERFYAGRGRPPLLRRTFLRTLVRRALGTLSGPGTSTPADADVDIGPLLAAYFGHGNAPSSPDAMVALARYIVRNNVPPLSLLGALRERVAATAATPGTSIEVQHAETEIKLRSSAAQYWNSVGGQFDHIQPHVEPPWWGRESVRDAIGVWEAA